MAKNRPRPSQPPKPDANRKPDSENVKRTSNPKTPKDQVNAISDDIKTETTEYIKNFYLEAMIIVDLMKSSQNGQEAQIEETIKEFITGGKRVFDKALTNARGGVYQTNLPFLKKISTDAVAELSTPDAKQSKINNKPAKKPGKK